MEGHKACVLQHMWQNPVDWFPQLADAKAGRRAPAQSVYRGGAFRKGTGACWGASRINQRSFKGSANGIVRGCRGCEKEMQGGVLIQVAPHAGH